MLGITSKSIEKKNQNYKGVEATTLQRSACLLEVPKKKVTNRDMAEPHKCNTNISLSPIY